LCSKNGGCKIQGPKEVKEVGWERGWLGALEPWSPEVFAVEPGAQSLSPPFGVWAKMMMLATGN